VEWSFFDASGGSVHAILDKYIEACNLRREEYDKPEARDAKGLLCPFHTAETKEGGMAGTKPKNSVARVLSLLVALIGCLITAVPFMFGVGDPGPVILVGSGVTVIALGLFLFFSI
jgi:hypothetical protein